MKLAFPLDKKKHLEELALVWIGMFLHEEDFKIGLDEYLRAEFLMSTIAGSKRIEDLTDINQQNICKCLFFILKYGQQPDGIGIMSKEDIWRVITFKTLGWNILHLGERSYYSRRPVWRIRLYQWLTISIVGEEHETNRGIRYSSYTKGYHDGKSLRTPSPEDSQILDREGYFEETKVSFFYDLIDPEEFRNNL